MVNSCSAINCTNCANKHTSLKFHNFSHEDKVLLKKWIVAMTQDKFKPSKHNNFSRESKKDSFPSVFDFPVRLKKMLHKGYQQKDVL